jgi:hypothetical protein
MKSTLSSKYPSFCGRKLKSYFSIFRDIYYKTKNMETKEKISITIDTEIYEKLLDQKINKSKLINWLLQQHYNISVNDKK